jgi:toxin HigB-1
MTQDIFDGVNSKNSRKLPIHLHNKARRLLDQINSARQVETLNVPLSNKLLKLSGNLYGYWRIKIDKQWAVIFKWSKSEASEFDIIDYH